MAGWIRWEASHSKECSQQNINDISEFPSFLVSIGDINYSGRRKVTEVKNPVRISEKIN